ncbi:EAL domain-containing protein [Rhodanobacter sp. L36]|uniref:EAL domain-containing protein n=1 Tax=Rhodanobacter sp. L36 TaxID=1747221 RepID=UPI00131DBA17|nr:EAL domain-containing protein [Rhodanobacter sp. L36]
MHDFSGHPGFGYFTTALLAAAAVALASGLQFLVIGLRQRRESMYLSYALLCLCIATLALASTMLDVSTVMPQATLALRIMCGAAVIAFPSLVMFVGTYTGKPVTRPVFFIVCLLAAVLFAVNLASPYSVMDSSLTPGVPTVLSWGETLYTVTGKRSLWGHAFYGLSYVAFVWTLYRAARQYLEGQRLSGALLGLCLAIQFTAALWGGVAIDTLSYHYPRIDVFAFLSFVVLMGLSLSSQLRLHTLQLERTAHELRAEAETRRQAELNLRHAAYHDALTGLPNRPRALYTLADMLADAVQSGQFGAVLMIDLDNFKTINDSLGHHVGDRVLEAIADSLLSAAPTDSTVARLGGDEFVILLGSLATDAEAAAAAAMKAAEELVERLSTPLAIDSRMLGIGASIGVAVFPSHEARATDIVRCADIAMYRAKAAGRNAARLFLPHMQHDADDRLELERGLRAALENQELSLHFQPHVSMAGKLVGAEALLRWQHPTLGSVPPATFIPIAEETGLIHALGTWVIAQACLHIRAWRERSVDFGGRLSVNVSPWQIAHPQFAQRIEAQVREAGVDPSWLTLELTESALLNDFDAALGTLHALSKIGFRLALDDFGTGYSSLAYLQQLPLDELKIDRTFINALQPNEPDPLAGFIIDVGRRLGMTTIAEGVETPQQKAMLKLLGCDILQGYLICRPLAEDDFLAWLSAREDSFDEEASTLA